MTALTFLRPQTSSTRNVLLVVTWFVVIYLLAAAGFFTTDGVEPPWRLGLAVGLPVAAVAVAVWRSEAVRAWADCLDLRLLIALQSWRFGGFVFIAMSANGLLPASFAIPASLGDVAMAVTAPFVANYVVRVGRAAMPLLIGWTIFGFLDLIAAVTLGILNSEGPLGILSDQVLTTDLVTRLPVVLIPTFGVPLMLVLHILALRAASRLR